MPYKDPEKQREYQRQWMADRRAEWFEGKSCVDCGSTERLELDHVDPADKIHHAIWSWKLERREEELAKCLVRCQGCHLAKGRANGDLGNRTLNVNQVRQILRSEETATSLAPRFGVAPQQIRRIRRREAWSHIKI